MCKVKYFGKTGARFVSQVVSAGKQRGYNVIFFILKSIESTVSCARDRSGNEAAECALFGGLKRRPRGSHF